MGGRANGDTVRLPAGWKTSIRFESLCVNVILAGTRPLINPSNECTSNAIASCNRADLPAGSGGNLYARVSPKSDPTSAETLSVSLGLALAPVAQHDDGAASPVGEKHGWRLVYAECDTGSIGLPLSKPGSGEEQQEQGRSKARLQDSPMAWIGRLSLWYGIVRAIAATCGSSRYATSEPTRATVSMPYPTARRQPGQGPSWGPSSFGPYGTLKMRAFRISRPSSILLRMHRRLEAPCSC